MKSELFHKAEKLFVKAEKMRGKNRLDRALDFLEKGEVRAKRDFRGALATDSVIPKKWIDRIRDG